MKLMISFWHWILQNTTHISLSHLEEEESTFLSTVEASIKEWQTYKNMFNHADPELTDYMIFRLSAAERHCMFLLAKAKIQGLKAWPDNLIEPVKINSFQHNGQD